jgi:rhodanese-related sulfurtransferase
MTTIESQPTTERIDAPRLRELMHEDATIRVLDVRTGGEFETVHIPGSYNVPLDALADRVKEFAELDQSVVLVCQSGGRASQACDKLTAAGSEQTLLLDGGMNAWTSAGGDVVRGETERWAMDRQVRLVAGSLVVAGVLASTVVPKAKWFSAAVGGGLLFSAVSNTCAMGTALSKLPYNRTAPCDVDGVLDDMRCAS